MAVCRSAVVAVALVVLGWISIGAADDRHHGAIMTPSVPAETGQSAFAAIAEIVAMLEADPVTDWTKVDLSALREHLVDMNALTLESETEETSLDDGVAITVTGSDRVLGAIHRMVPAHAVELDKMPIWSASSETMPDGAKLIVTSPEPAIQARIRALGFFGLMATGGHHQAHHLAIAKAVSVHQHAH